MSSNTKIFISHSTKDRDYAGEIINLLLGIGISHERIFCSSFEGNNVQLGENFIKSIKEELENKPISLLLISPNFYSSPMSMCELGAIWGMGIKHVSILIPPMTYSDLHIAFDREQSMTINDSEKLDSMYQLLQSNLELKPINPAIWNRTKEVFLNNVDYLLKKNTFK